MASGPCNILGDFVLESASLDKLDSLDSLIRCADSGVGMNYHFAVEAKLLLCDLCCWWMSLQQKEGEKWLVGEANK